MSLLNDVLKLKRVDLTKDLFNKYREALLDMLTVQYYAKDPSSAGCSYEVLYKYFEDEYESIFTTDASYKAGFLYFDEEENFVGGFMIRDAYLTGKVHEKAMVNMKPTDDFYDFYVALLKHFAELWSKYGIKENDAIYGTNLVFSAKFLTKFKGKAVLNLIFAMFADLSQFWATRLPEFKYGVWVQLRPSLYTTTMKVFNVVEGRDFVFMDDKGTQVEGKLFLVTKKEPEEVMKLWEPVG